MTTSEKRRPQNVFVRKYLLMIPDPEMCILPSQYESYFQIKKKNQICNFLRRVSLLVIYGPGGP